MPIDAEDRTDIHTYFGLTYSNYLALHRTFLQSMPEEWQHRFTAMLGELHEAFAHVEQPASFIVTAATECTYSDLNETDMRELGVTLPNDADGEDGDDLPDVYYDRDGNEHGPDDSLLAPLPGEDPVPHYNRGRTRIEPRLI